MTEKKRRISAGERDRRRSERAKTFPDPDPNEKTHLRAHAAEPTFGIQVGEVEISTHPPAACAGEWCVIHNPSDHIMRDWPMNFRMDNAALVERLCPHGIGHPDPDSVAYFMRQGMSSMSVHGCDGCCRGR